MIPPPMIAKSKGEAEEEEYDDDVDDGVDKVEKCDCGCSRLSRIRLEEDDEDGMGRHTNDGRIVLNG